MREFQLAKGINFIYFSENSQRWDEKNQSNAFDQNPSIQEQTKKNYHEPPKEPVFETFGKNTDPSHFHELERKPQDYDEVKALPNDYINIKQK